MNTNKMSLEGHQVMGLLMKSGDTTVKITNTCMHIIHIFMTVWAANKRAF